VVRNFATSIEKRTVYLPKIDALIFIRNTFQKATIKEYHTVVVIMQTGRNVSQKWRDGCYEETSDGSQKWFRLLLLAMAVTKRLRVECTNV